MRKLLLIIIGLIPLFVFSQKNIQKEIKKLGLEVADVVYTDETVLLYPRGFIYNADEVDSVSYFSCFSSVIEDVTEYFEGRSKMIKIAIESKILRKTEGYTDTIKMELLENKVKHFKQIDKTEFSIDNDAKIIVMYYWQPKMMRKHYAKFFKEFKGYAKNHPEKKIQIVAVLVD